MKEITLRASVAALVLAAVHPGCFAAEKLKTAEERLKTIEEKTRDMKPLDGFFPVYWEESTGHLWLEIRQFDTDFLYVTSLASGLGSNDLELDRGQPSDAVVVCFNRIGPRVLLIQRNQAFRSTSPNEAERRSVEDSFAKSVLAGFEVGAESGNRVLVDATDFFLRDGHRAARALKPGTYEVDKDRSAFYLPGTKSFPKNTEVEVLLTFKGGSDISNNNQPAGTDPLFTGMVDSVSPNAGAVTLREHYSLVQLPDDKYKPRRFDPRAGYFNTEYMDYSAPLTQPIIQRFTLRHRLEKKDPQAQVSEPVEPIQYYVDPGAPEDIRHALIEGANWWNTAFEAAGFRNAFRVEVLPPDKDPMDIRYNIIYWVHRSTRGWSIGDAIVDPRSGEIIRGVVRLGSLRDRQDYLIFEGLLSPYSTGTEKPPILYETAMARIRQLAAHEVGHTLGLHHNYYNSSRGWISVMDYPHPQEKLAADGSIDLSSAYAAHIGDWDKVAINYGYRQFANEADERAALPKMLEAAWSEDLRFFSNQDLGTHPRVDQWSNGVNQAEELMRIMKIRRAALDRMGENTIPEGVPMALIEEALVPIFLYHRYSVQSAASSLGGVDYIYAIRGDKRTPVKWESAANQRKVLDALVGTLRPSELTVPAKVLASIPPRPLGFGKHRELFARTTGDAFDPLAPAVVAADLTIAAVLRPERAARLLAQHAVDPSLPGLGEVIDRLTAATFDTPAKSGYEAEVRRAGEKVLVDRLTSLATSAPNFNVRAIATGSLAAIAARAGSSSTSAAERAHLALLAADIKRVLNRPAEPLKPTPTPELPPGPPIGDDSGMNWLAEFGKSTGTRSVRK